MRNDGVNENKNAAGSHGEKIIILEISFKGRTGKTCWWIACRHKKIKEAY